jgi:hypothetical protein
MLDPVDMFPKTCPRCGREAYFNYTKEAAHARLPLCWDDSSCAAKEKTREETMAKTATISKSEFETEFRDVYARASVETCQNLESLLEKQGEARAAKIVGVFRERLLFNAQAAESDSL